MDPQGIKKVAILGGGAGGYSAAADLSLRGFPVTLYELPRFESHIREMAQRGGIAVKGAVKRNFVKIDQITTDIQEAIRDASIIMLIVPSYGMEEFARQCLPHLQDGQEIVWNGAACLGALRFKLLAEKLAPHLKIRVAETATLPYCCRQTGPAEVKINLFVQNIFYSAFPAIHTPGMLKTFQSLYPSMIQAKNILETTLNYGNSILHPPGAVLNATRIDARGEFCLYTEGVSPSVARVIEAVDRERLALCQALGLQLITSRERLVRYGYSKRADTLCEEMVKSEVFAEAKGPFDIHHRYLTEDIPYGLVLWSSLGTALGVSTPVMDGLIEIGSVLCQRNFREEGLTLKKLGLEGMNGTQLSHYMRTGER